jgi:heparanase 1
LARKDTKVVVRQTLAGMNYGMIDDATLLPRPDYWNSWLWKQLMGSKVYQVSVAGNDASHLRAYAHSSITSKTRETTVLLINIDPEKTVSVNLKGLPDSGRRVFAVTTPDIFGQHLMVNGRELSLGASGEIPELGSFGSSESQGTKLFIHPLSYTFVQLIERQ